MNEHTIIRTVPAADELHKVPGFNPMEYLRKAVNAKGEPVMRLEPHYQRLWFRLAYPKGRMLLNPLRVTDQLAIFEAKVFFHTDDPAPASSFTSNKTAQETPNYIRAAQDEALKEALDNAGFGIQLCDVTQAVGVEPSAAIAPPVQAKSVSTGVEEPALSQSDIPPAREAPVAPAPEEVHAGLPASEAPPAAPEQVRETCAAEGLPAAPAEAGETAQEEHQDTVSAAQQNKSARQGEAPSGDSQQPTVTEILNFHAPSKEFAAPQKTGADMSAESGADGGAPAEAAASNYTNDMPVEEILPLMTMEEAEAVVVARGPNAGLTMAKVAERRPSSLRFFLTSFSDCGNIQKAAATLLIQRLEQKKAG